MNKSLLICLVAFTISVCGTSLLTQHQDSTRSGWNSQETILNVQSITSGRFVLLNTSTTLTAPCTTQILYYENFVYGGATRNVLFCWTDNGSQGYTVGGGGNVTVYAFDAKTLLILWSVYIGSAAGSTNQGAVIDPTTNIMYFVYKNLDQYSGTNFLVAIDITQGTQLPDSPKLINATYPGYSIGDGNVNGILVFQDNPANVSTRLNYDCHTSLLLWNSAVYFGFASNNPPYHGWLFGYLYDTVASKFNQLGFFCVTPNATAADAESNSSVYGSGGIWQSGLGIATDGSYLYFSTGKGYFSPENNSYAISVLKLSPTTFTVVDYYSPTNEKSLSDANEDFGGNGPVFIPNTKLFVIGVTKFGSVYLLNSSSLGKWNPTSDTSVQSFKVSSGNSIPGGNPAVWSDGHSVTRFYTWQVGSGLTQFDFNSSNLINLPPIVWANDTSGGEMTISSNGGSNAILWAFSRKAVLYAFDATKDISAGPIWKQALPGSAPDWFWPTVVNGQVYVSSTSNEVFIFGLNTTSHATLFTNSILCWFVVAVFVGFL